MQPNTSQGARPVSTGGKAKFEDQEVTVLRDARESDPGFNAAKPGTQVIVKLSDGTERTVDRATLQG